MTITVGEKSVDVPFTMTLHEPCDDAILTLADIDPFAGTHIYELGSSPIEIFYDVDTLVESDVRTTCG